MTGSQLRPQPAALQLSVALPSYHVPLLHHRVSDCVAIVVIVVVVVWRRTLCCWGPCISERKEMDAREFPPAAPQPQPLRGKRLFASVASTTLAANENGHSPASSSLALKVQMPVYHNIGNPPCSLAPDTGF